VVTKVTYKTYPAIREITAILVNVTYTTASYHGFLKTLLTLQPALAAHNFSGYFFPYPTIFSAALLVHNSANVTGANATLTPLYDFAASETGQGRPVAIQMQSYVLTDYFQLFPNDPTKDSESAGMAGIVGSRLAPITAFQEEGSVDALVNFIENVPEVAELQFHLSTCSTFVLEIPILIDLLVAGGKVSTVAGNATAVHPSWRRASHHIIVATGWRTNTTFATRDLIRRGLTNTTQTLASIVPGFGAYVNE